MNVVSYMKAHRYSLVTSLLLWALVDALILASTSLQRGLPDFGYMNLLLAVTFLVGNGVGWMRERGRFAPLRNAIDREQPLEGVLPTGSGYHESLLREAVELERKTWVARIADVRSNTEELQDYIVQWTHEIKIPLSVLELIVEQTQEASSQSVTANEGEHANRIRLPLERVKFLVNQVLYAGRAAHSQDDLATCDFSLQKVLRTAIRTNAPFFLAKDIAIEATPLDFSVTSDEKWIQYVFEQILHNAAKYIHPGGTVHIRASEREKGILVEIQDTVIGTFWLFGAVVPLISRLLMKSPRTMYRGVRLIAISNIVFRLRSNYRSLAMMAVMTATTVTAFGTSLSLKYFVSETMHLQCPWSYSGVFNDVTKEEGIRETILASEHTLLDEVRVEIRKVPASVVDNLGTDMTFARLIRHSDLERIQASVETRYPGKSAAVPTLAEEEAMYLISPATIGGAVHMKGRRAIFPAESGVAPVRFVKQDRVPLFGKGSMYQKDFVVVTDSVWDAFTGTPFELEVFHGYAVSDGYMGEALGKKLAAMLPKEAQFFSLAVRYRDEESYYGLFFFLGSFLSVVFLFATGSIYYFKVLSEGLADREKYSVLMRLGLTGKELKQAVTLQLGLSLVIPLLVGLLHSVFAVAELSSLLAYSLTTPYLWAVGVYLLCYVGINAVTTRKFLSLVQAEPGAAREMAA